ncbi:MAG: peptide chain release factor N(5)-glutamine methyltransferase [Pseudomonadota bacterium]
MATIKSALAEAQSTLERTCPSPRLDAEILLAVALAKSRPHLHAWPDKSLTDDQYRRFKNAVEKRALGTPVAYITGEREFWSRKFTITPDVLIPRPETELLVEITLELISRKRKCRVIDLGAGSGAIAVTLAAERPVLQVVATDICAKALQVAEINAARYTADNIEFVQSDWFGDLSQDTFDLIISNPPYIAENDPHLVREDIRFEPQKALISGPDGLDDIRKIASQSVGRLAGGGYILFEHGYDQAPAVGALLSALGYNSVRHYRDMQGHARVTSAQHAPGCTADRVTAKKRRTDSTP